MPLLSGALNCNALGIIVLEGNDFGPVPTLLIAATSNVYCIKLIREAIVCVVAVLKNV